MKHTQITFKPVKGVPLVFEVKSVVWGEEVSENPPATYTGVFTQKIRMRLSRKFRKALVHAARNTTPMSLRRIKK